MFSNYFSGRRVWVSGHTGFKGSWLTEWLLSLGAEVCGFSKDVPTQPALFDTLQLRERITHDVGDVRNREAVYASIKRFEPEVVLHLAAQSLVAKSYEDPAETFETNVLGTAYVMEAIRRSPHIQTAVIVTSDKCYENKEWDYGYREIDPLGGKDPYSASKACSELVYSSYFKSFPDQSARVASVRAGNVIGGGDWARMRIVPDTMRAWSNKSPIELRYPHSTRPWQHVLEPLSGYLSLLANMAKPENSSLAEPFNFGPSSTSNRKVIELVQELKKSWPVPDSLIRSSHQVHPHEAGKLNLVYDKAFNKIAWYPTLSFEESVELTARWYKHYFETGETQHRSASFLREQIQEYSQLALSRGLKWANTST